MEERGVTLWMTGLSGSGKSTIADLLKAELDRRKKKVEVLDGDIIRTNLSKGLGFSHEDRVTNLKRIGFVCKLLSRNGVVAVVAAITPYEEVRRILREDDPNYVEVFVNAPLEVCQRRDPKGLYAKVKAGEIKHFTGIDDPYDAPTNPDIEVHTDREEPAESCGRIITRLEELGFLAPDQPDDAYTDDDAEIINKRLESLGYL